MQSLLGSKLSSRKGRDMSILLLLLLLSSPLHWQRHRVRRKRRRRRSKRKRRGEEAGRAPTLPSSLSFLSPPPLSPPPLVCISPSTALAPFPPPPPPPRLSLSLEESLLNDAANEDVFLAHFHFVFPDCLCSLTAARRAEIERKAHGAREDRSLCLDGSSTHVTGILHGWNGCRLSCTSAVALY